MHAGTLRTLEFDRIVAIVADLAVTPMGRAEIEALTPLTSATRVAAALGATSEGVRFLEAHPGFPLRAPAELEAALEALATEGRALEPLRLLGLAEFLESIEQTRESVAQAGTTLPYLMRLVEGVASFRNEIADVRRKIEPSGEVADNASPALASIRERLRKQRGKLRSTLESFLRERETSKYLQEQVVTDRNGRYVLMVRAEHRGAIPGIVHGASASGASLFLEPLGTVDINNEIVELEEREAEEVRRILLALTDAFRARPDDLERTIGVATAAGRRAGQGALLADDGGRRAEPQHRRRAGAGRGAPSAAPAARAGGRRTRDPKTADRSRFVIPVDVRLPPPTRVLIIAGPNTGGKTVALKTAGLFAAMAQAGPACAGGEGIEAAGVPRHLRRHRRRAVDRRQPVHVLGPHHQPGVDGPQPGAAGAGAAGRGGRRHRSGRGRRARHGRDRPLPQARRARGGHDPLRRAEDLRRHDRGRDQRRVRLRPGDVRADLPAHLRVAGPQPGHRDRRAAGHAARASSPPRAATCRTARRSSPRTSSAWIANCARWSRSAKGLGQQRLELAEGERRLRGQRGVAAREGRRASSAALGAKVDDQLRDARREIDAVIEGLKARATVLREKGERRAAGPLSTGEIGHGAVRGHCGAGRGGRAAQDRRRAARRIGARRPRPEPLPDLGPGVRVAVGPLGLEGTVLEIHGKHAEVDVRGKRLRARVARPARRSARRRRRGPASASICSRATGSLTELNVVGCTVDEALTRAGRFLDETMLTDLREVRVIHGHGTGQLRRALTAFFKEHPLVARFEHPARARRRRRDGGRAEGLDGHATLVALFPQRFVEDLKQQADIVTVIQDYVSLRKTGATYKGLCPFHGEKTPSFHVNRDKGFFHCFGCGVGGDVFKFLELHDKIGFPGGGEAAGAALRHAAARAGTERRAARRRPGARDAPEDPRGGRGVVHASSWPRPPRPGCGRLWPTAA